MQVIWHTDAYGETSTTCLYLLDGEPSSARLPGHLTPVFAQQVIESMRKAANNPTT